MTGFNKKYALDISSADTALQNIFAAVGQTPNSVPFNKLVLRQKAVLKPYNIMLTICILLLAATVICPLCFYVNKPTAAMPGHVTLGSHSATDEKITLEVLPPYMMVDVSSSELITVSGETYAPLGYDYNTHTITFPYPGEECNIYIYCDNDCSLQLVFTPTQQ